MAGPPSTTFSIKDLAARGIRAIDLRPIIWTVRSKAPAYFLYDTHWTPRAAIAGFNAVSEADGHRGWRIDADAALARSSQRKGGDLARMIGVSNDVAEPHQEMALPSVSKVELTTGQFPSYVATRDKPGETVMIIGDSFTVYYFAPMLLNHVGRVVWQHHKWCGFDWKLIDRFRPDEVWWMPTERYLLCIPPTPARTASQAARVMTLAHCRPAVDGWRLRCSGCGGKQINVRPAWHTARDGWGQ
jgi:alginate O-acetyltransferase complex protein AlgJ